MADEWNFLLKTMDAFLLEAETARDEREFNAVVSRLLPEAIPADHPCAIMHLGAEASVPTALSGDPHFLKDFSEYFRYRLPFDEKYAQSRAAIDFEEFRDCEYMVDFLKPNGIRHVLGAYRGYIPNLLRSRSSPPFSERECRLFHLLVPHLDRLYRYHLRAPLSARDSIRPAELAYNCRILSRREDEIVRLSSRRMTAKEIASQLSISRRTVERHLSNAYGKLGVCDRAGLMAKLYGIE